MKRNLKRKVLCLTLSACLTVSNIPGGGYSVFAYPSGSTSQKESIALGASSLEGVRVSTSSNGADNKKPEDLVADSKASDSNARALADWELQNPQGAEILAMDGDWIHFKSGIGNDNKNKPAILLNKDNSQLKDGFMEFTFKSKETVAQTTRFGVYARYKAPELGIFVGYDKIGWYWQVYDGKTNAYYTGNRKAGPAAGVETKVKVEFIGDLMDVYIDDVLLFDNVNIATVPAAGGIGFRAGYWNATPPEPTDVLIKDISFAAEKTYSVSGTVVDEAEAPVKGATVTVGASSAATAENGTFTLSDISKGIHQLSVSKIGYEIKTQDITVTDSDVSNVKVVVKAKDLGTAKEIKSEKMSVMVDDKFPRVISYTYKDKEFAGQEDPLSKIKINGAELTPTKIVTDFTDSKATYVMTVLDLLSGVDADITAELAVVDNTLEFNITDIVDRKIVKTIEIPNHNLVTVKSTDAGAEIAGAIMSTNTHVSGDKILPVDSNFNVADNAKKGYMYALLSNGNLSAGLWSNSANKVSADWQRITATAAQKTGYKEVALSSTFWTYQKDTEYRKENGKIDYGNGFIMDLAEMPTAKVVITDDLNEDAKIDWQDGAIAYRDIMDNPLGSEKVPEYVSYRINMNFGSQAQNPFLSALDGVKKISLHTDGLGQSILLKGYGSEGHDSGHLNYADIGRRIGGAEEMKVMLKKGKEYGAVFGIHVNASETYPESIYFEEDRLLKTANGVYDYGWNWIDQGININADYDLRNGRAGRFKDLYDKLGGADNDLDFIYVDVWGNGQSGDNGTWPSHQLSKEINGLNWRLGGEWGHAFENASTFQHWAADLTYGGYSSKGINSDITRFIRNHQKDSWVGNYPAYGGAAEAPLLGGYNMKDFEGWQGRSDYGAYISNMYEVDVPSKFVQHFLVTNWVEGTPVSMSDNGQTYSWTPEMSVTLKDKENVNELVITRDSNDYTNKNAYRSRVMTFNDKVILKGREGASTYLIPWFWDQNGIDLAESDTKLYHWNTTGKETTWEVPDDWSGTAYLYELTDLGKTNMVEVPIIDGEITLDVKAGVPYVLHKSQKENVEMTWSEGMSIVDSGFNSNSLDNWTITGETAAASIVRSQGSNFMLRIADNTETVTLSQEFTDLRPNTKYAVYLGVDNRSEVNGVMEVSSNGKVFSNSAPKSIALNYIQAYAHNTLERNATVDNKSYFQNLYVFFETGDDGRATLTLKRDGGSGAIYFDDVRVVETKANNQVSDTKFVQDFEEVTQGIWPFVIGNIEGVQDNRTHLSEKNNPYTQIGWNGKAVDDVINGTWSLKTNGLTQKQKLVYQTIPQNFKFEPGVDYVIRFDYEAGSDDTYAVVYNDKPFVEFGAYFQQKMPGTVDLGRAAQHAFTLTGSENGQTWFGIYSTDVAADTKGVTLDKQISFNGYNDFILDNLMIEVSPAQKPALRAVIEESLLREQNNFTEASWKNFAYVLKAAQDINADLTADQAKVDNAVTALEKALSELVKTGGSIVGSVVDTDEEPVAGVKVVLVSADGKQYFSYTDKNGIYRIPGGFYGVNTVTVDDTAYLKAQKTTTTAPEKETASVDFVLTPAVTSLSGKVTVAGQAVAEASVTISAKGLEDKTITTDANGNYKFDNVVVRNYQLSVNKDGYDALSINVPTTKVRATAKDIMLSPITGADYINDFEKGVSTLSNLSGNATFSSDNGKAKIVYSGTGNVYDTASPMFLNGSVEVDITPATDATRLGLILRASAENKRVYVGSMDAVDVWFAEHWGTGGNAWSGGYNAVGPNGNIGFKAGVPVHLKAEIVDKNIKLWVNDILTIDLNMNGMHMEPGYVGFYARGARTITVDNLKVTSYDVAEGVNQTIVGRVVDDTGAPVSGLQVAINGKTKAAFTKTATTNANGEYKFKGIPLGEYDVTIPGANDVRVPIKVEETPFYNMVELVVQGVQPTVIKSELLNIITRAKVLVQDDYTEGSWNAFTKALKDAEVYAENSNATQDGVKTAINTLKSAMDGLKASANKEMLDITISAVEDTFAEDTYTPETWKVYAAALNQAKAVSADANATQEQVDKALGDLTNAVNSLLTKLDVVNKDKLKFEISVAERMLTVLNKANYTSESWASLEAALAAAKKCFIDTNALQPDVDKALTALQTAMKGLKTTGGSSGGNGGGSGSGGSGGSGSSGSGSSVGSKWKQNATGWWYEDSNGNYPSNSWKQINSKWYYFDGTGYMAEGWRLVNNVWYYMQPGAGFMITGWIQTGGVWYYSNTSGAMQTGWVQVNGKWYYFSSNGSMLANTTTPDGFKVDGNGAWIQ